MFSRILIGLFFLVAMVVSEWSGFARGALQEKMFIDVLDVGQGDAILISENGYRLLIDGGPGRAVTKSLPKSMPFFTASLDGVLLTHPHADHSDGLLAVLDRYRVGTLYLPDVKGIAEAGKVPELLTVAKEQDVAVQYVGQGDVIEIGALRFDVLWPTHGMVQSEDMNDVSIVVRLLDHDHDGDDEGVFTGDAGELIEKVLLEKGLVRPAELLKVGHHGSKTSTSEVFVNAVHPRFAAISLGRNNRYKHPAERVISLFKDTATPVFRTDQGGTATFVLDDGCLKEAGRGGKLDGEMSLSFLLNKPAGSCTLMPNYITP